MPITQSAKKALRQNRRRHEKNAEQKKTLKALVKSYEKNPTAEALARVYQALDKAAKRKLLEKNTAARQKSRLSRLLRTSK